MRLYVNDNEVDVLKKALGEYIAMNLDEGIKRDSLLNKVIKCENLQTNHKITIIID